MPLGRPRSRVVAAAASARRGGLRARAPGARRRPAGAAVPRPLFDRADIRGEGRHLRRRGSTGRQLRPGRSIRTDQFPSAQRDYVRFDTPGLHGQYFEAGHASSVQQPRQPARRRGLLAEQQRWGRRVSSGTVRPSPARSWATRPQLAPAGGPRSTSPPPCDATGPCARRVTSAWWSVTRRSPTRPTPPCSREAETDFASRETGSDRTAARPDHLAGAHGFRPRRRARRRRRPRHPGLRPRCPGRPPPSSPRRQLHRGRGQRPGCRQRQPGRHPLLPVGNDQREDHTEGRSGVRRARDPRRPRQHRSCLRRFGPRRHDHEPRGAQLQPRATERRGRARGRQLDASQCERPQQRLGRHLHRRQQRQDHRRQGERPCRARHR